MLVQVHLRPVQSSFLFASMPVGIALGMFAAERSARALGRVPTMLLFKAVAVGLLALMALDTRLWALPSLIVPIYLVRTMLANCTRALSRSILMDYVPKVRRRKAWQYAEATRTLLHSRCQWHACDGAQLPRTCIPGRPGNAGVSACDWPSTTSAPSPEVITHAYVQAQRGRWSCVDGVTVFGWSGSALLGGYLIDRHGFAMVFLLTAGLQLASTAAFNAPLLAMVPRTEAQCGCCVVVAHDEHAGAGGGRQESASPVRAAAPALALGRICEECGCQLKRRASGEAACCCGVRRVGTGPLCIGKGGGRSSRRDSVEGAVEALAQSYDDEGSTLSQPLLHVDRQCSRDSRTSGN
jgi:hypothetical protein